jgi:hypothetical protein
VGEFTIVNTGYIYLFPGLNNGIGVRPAALDQFCRTQPYTNHGALTQQPNPDPLGGPIYLQDPTTAISKWRIVSQGLKLTLVNNSDENDGWWEAIRLTINGTDRRITKDTGALGDTPGSPGFTNISEELLNPTNMVEQPTYTTGKLRDIHRHLFVLRPEGSEHEFQTLRGDFRAQTDDSLDTVFDKSFDVIVIKVHARKLAAGATEGQTRLMTHVVCNQEIIYDEKSFLSRYHERKFANAASVKQIQNVNTKRPISASYLMV